MTKKDLNKIIGENIYYLNRECKLINIDEKNKYIHIMWIDNQVHDKVNINELLKNIRNPKKIKKSKITKTELKELIDTEIQINGRKCIIKSIDEKENLIKIYWLDKNRLSSRELDTFIKDYEKLKNKKVKQKNNQNINIPESILDKIINNFENELKKIKHF